ncbi:MAG: anthranilate synthase component I [Spirochaetales bacterium]|nr:anthranilate synthase component I [Spirochaetales bacterium]
MSKTRTDGIIRELAGERFTPYSLARKLKASVILESSSFKKGKERYSILLVKEAFKVIQQDKDIFMLKDGKKSKIKSNARDILTILKYFAEQHPRMHAELPVPAGGVGFLSYEFCRFCDTITIDVKNDPLDIPDAVFILGHIFVVFDHYTDLIYVVGLNYNEHKVNLEKLINETIGELHDLNFNYLTPPQTNFSVEITDSPEIRENFLKGVETVREEIIKGNLLQGVLSRRMHVKTDLSALEAYRNLRSANPSPYLFYIDFDEYQLFGASPEVHVKVKDGRAIIHPIAGTRRKGKDKNEDKALEKELLGDPKERAEHVMLVDLARNDLGRICEAGSVEVTGYMNIEHYSHVMHIVSIVEGNLRSGKTGLDAIRATFPAGTVSGAPKIQAIETIARLENESRRFYAGLLGYIDANGDLDTCITIRAGFKKGDLLILQAGAGIVYDSKPEREYEETNEKIRALAVSIGLEV